MSEDKRINSIQHVAIIMDGNGRWAQRRSRPRVWGHIRGAQVVSKIVTNACEQDLSALTLYSFSTENWSRPLKEVSTIFNIFKKFIKSERSRIVKNNIRFKVIGEIDKLPVDLQNLILSMEEDTKDMDGLKLSVAFGYGGRNEIISAVNKSISKNPGKVLTEADLQNNLMFPEAGDVDLLIRTGGEYRVSNFLLWQIAYAELSFTETAWPNFTVNEFQSICENARNRERRFGTISWQKKLDDAKQIASLNKNELKMNL